MLASGQIQLNAQGVPIVQPGQVLQFDLSDTSAAQLGGRAIAVESAGRAQREALAAQQAAETYTGAGGGRGFVNPALASEHGRYPFAGRSTITDPNAYIDPRQRTMTLADMSNMPAEKYSAEDWRAAAQEYKQIQGKDFSRDSIYNGLWTKAAQLDAEAGKGLSRDVINDITGFATSEGLNAQAGVAIGGALGRGIGNRLGGTVDNALVAIGKKPDGAVPVAGSGVGGVSTNGANGGTATAGGTANVATYAGLKLDLKTTQAANEVVESLQTTGKLPPNYVDKAQAAQQGWQPGKALNNFVPGGQLGGDVFNNVPPVNGLPQAANRTWQEVDI